MNGKKRTLHGEKSIENIVRCLQEHSTQNVTRAARKITEPSFLSKFAPIIDGQVKKKHLFIHYNVHLDIEIVNNLFCNIEIK